MADFAEPLNDLERALAETQRGEKTNTEFVQLLVQSPLFVLLSKPWDGRSTPDEDTRMLLVSDGENTDQAMQAVFTDAARAQAFAEAAPGFSVACMPAMMIFLGVREEQGVIVNPNSALTMKIKPPAAKIISDTAKELLERARAERAAAEPGGIEPDG